MPPRTVSDPRGLRHPNTTVNRDHFLVTTPTPSPVPARATVWSTSTRTSAACTISIGSRAASLDCLVQVDHQRENAGGDVRERAIPTPPQEKHAGVNTATTCHRRDRVSTPIALRADTSWCFGQWSKLSCQLNRRRSPHLWDGALGTCQGNSLHRLPR